MSVIKITKHTSSKTGQMEVLISIMCLLNDIKLSDTATKVLAHYLAFGLKASTDELLIKSKVVTDISGLRNTKTLLKNLGFLKRTKELYKSYELNLDAGFKPDDTVTLLIKLDNGERN